MKIVSNVIQVRRKVQSECAYQVLKEPVQSMRILISLAKRIRKGPCDALHILLGDFTFVREPCGPTLPMDKEPRQINYNHCGRPNNSVYDRDQEDEVEYNLGTPLERRSRVPGSPPGPVEEVNHQEATALQPSSGDNGTVMPDVEGQQYSTIHNILLDIERQLASGLQEIITELIAIKGRLAVIEDAVLGRSIAMTGISQPSSDYDDDYGSMSDSESTSSIHT
ncbi:unnamed protein product [Dibothriocephalus latus]|uniref:Uncharacterized protein n=1 Tax=Dibothriocephalus latus TaxID=60516 RepID=A0A3P6PXK6_DIBLA|nr:unnamed protein product [Dibothriocephalus latus]